MHCLYHTSDLLSRMKDVNRDLVWHNLCVVGVWFQQHENGYFLK